MKKRHELPNFTKINVEVDVEKILKLFNDNFENLEQKRDYLNTRYGSEFLSEFNYDQYQITEYNDKAERHYMNLHADDDETILS